MSGQTRLQDLGVVSVADVIANSNQPLLLYTPATNERIVMLIPDQESVVATDSLYLGVVSLDAHAVYPVVTWGVFVNHAGGCLVFDLGGNADGAAPLGMVSDPLYVALTDHCTVTGNWAPNTDYADVTTGPAGVVGNDGHIWRNVGAAGTSGGSSPDFAGNEGGTVADGPDIVWHDSGAAPTTGSVHLYALIATV